MYAAFRCQYRAFARLGLATAAILLVPLVAMRFSNEVRWSGGDFAAMGCLLFGGGTLFLVVAQRAARRHRVRLAGAFAIALLYIWVELAVGLFTGFGS